MSTEPQIDRGRLTRLMEGRYRNGELTIPEAVAAYQRRPITVSRAAEACGLSYREMSARLRAYGVDPRTGPPSAEEL